LQLTFFCSILVSLFFSNRGSSKQFHGFNFFQTNQIQPQLLREGLCFPIMPFYIIYLSCIWAFIYILKYFLFLWIVISLFSSKAEQKDALNNIVLSAYLHLQSDGFLTTWTNSFVGPWDPSQGEHNPGNKLIIKCITCLQQFFNSIFVTFGLN
jgi:hypothetical protein